jgi:hypothetical protein
MSLFELLSNFLEPFLELFPRVARRPAANEWMVIDSPWGVRIGSLPILYIPTLSHVEYYPKHALPIDCGLQRVTTADGKKVAINATALIEIVDPVVLRLAVGGEHEEASAMSIRHAVCETAMGHNLSHLIAMWQEGEGFDDVSEYLYSIGIELSVVKVEDLQSVIPLSLLS